MLTPIVLGLIFFRFSALADPQITSWLTGYSGQYVRAYTNTAERTSGTTVTTWVKQSVPVYADVPFVAYSASWVYVRCPDLPSYVIGPWLNPNFQPGQLYPTNQHSIIRIPRSPAVQSGTKDITSTGTSGLWVNGVQIFNFTDGKAWDPTNHDIVGGSHNKPTFYWHRNAPTQWAEKTNFDYALGHQIPSGVYHTHQEAIALRYQLGDHVDYNSSTKNYSESTSTPTNHSPILGWSFDGYPIYGPYGYSISNDSSSGIRRMVSGYVQRDGFNGTDNLTNDLTTIPAWYARFRQNHFSPPVYSTTTTQSRPAVQGTNTLGTFAEDYDYYGDITNPATGQLYIMGTNTFDLDEYNGRWCVTPEFPGGTYAYFVDVDSNGISAYPYTFAYEFYGNDTGGSVASISEAVTTNFIGGADSALNVNSATADTNYVVTLVWSSTEGGTYQVESSTNDSTWTVEEANISATTKTDITTNTYTSSVSNGTVYVRVTRTALADYDPIDFESGVVKQTNVLSFMIGNDAPTVANPIPDQTADYGSAFSYTFPANTFTDIDSGQTLTYTASGDVLGAASGISFDASTRTFSATTVDSGDGGTIVGSHTIEVIATDDGTPVMSVTNSFALIINKAAASVTVDSFTRAYGSTNPIFTGALSNFVAADSITANYSTFAGPGQGSGSYPITVTLNDPQSVLGNYIVTTNNGTLTITDAVLTVMASNVSRSYGATNPVFSPLYSGFVNGQNSSVLYGAPSLTTSATTNSAVGNYNITASIGTLSSDNYSFNFADGTLTVTQASLTVMPDNFSRAYGQTNPILTGIISGIQNNDNISANYSTTATTNSPVGDYPITASLNDPDSKLSNYNVTTNAGTLSITNTSTVISFNFTGTSGNNGTASPMATNEVAGVLQAANWNNSTNQSSGALDNLVDSSGVATPASITWSGTGIGTTAEGNNAGDDRMMKGYVDVTNGATGTITVTNIPGSISGGSYDVLVYFDGANGSADRNAEFMLGSAFFYGKDYTSYSGTYIQATTTNNNTISTPGANFVLFTNVSGNSFTVTATPGYANDGNPHAEFNGIQIIADSAAVTAVTTNPVDEAVCDNEPAMFTAAAQSASVLSVQWQVSADGGNSFTDVSGATNTTLTFNAWITDDGDQYRAVFSGYTGSATTTPATLTVNESPGATIVTGSTNVIGNSTGNTASASPPAPGTYTYFWTINNGTITDGTNAQTVTYTAGASGDVTLGLVVANASGCTASNSIDVPIWALSSGLQSFTNADSLVSLATNVTKNYTFTDPSNGLSVVVAVTMTPYSESNASPVFSLFDTYGPNGSPVHLGMDSGIGGGDHNDVDSFEGVNFSASLVSASDDIATNSIQFGIEDIGIRPNNGIATWASSVSPLRNIPLGAENLFAMDTNTLALNNATYSGQLRPTGDFQLSDNVDASYQGLVFKVTFYEGSIPGTTPTVGTLVYTNGQFQFSVSGTTGADYIIEAATNLSDPLWIPIFTNTAPFTFDESNLNLYQQRFYRAVSQ